MRSQIWRQESESKGVVFFWFWRRSWSRKVQKLESDSGFRVVFFPVWESEPDSNRFKGRSWSRDLKSGRVVISLLSEWET